MLNKLAKVIRVITIPPFMVAILLTLLYFLDDVFPSTLDFVLELFFLAIVPVLAYPVQKLIPRLAKGGRKTQRNMAFVFSFVGYGGAVVCSILRNAIPNLLYVSVVYFGSVVLLTLLNCLTPWHASGHACSISGPILLICLFIGNFAILGGVLLFLAALWASLHMKRHTLLEFGLGVLCAFLSALITYFLIHPVF